MPTMTSGRETWPLTTEQEVMAREMKRLRKIAGKQDGTEKKK